MRAVLDIIMVALNLYTWIIIAGAILSWLIAFGVVNIRNDVVRAVWNLFHALTEPFLRPIRNFLPNTGGVDISPIILLLGVMLRRADHRLLRLSERLLEAAMTDAPSSQDRRRPLLRGFPDRRDDPARDAAHAERRRRLALFGALRLAFRARRARRPSPARSAIRQARSTICSPSMSSSARRCPTSRSTPSPISAMPTAGF